MFKMNIIRNSIVFHRELCFNYNSTNHLLQYISPITHEEFPFILNTFLLLQCNAYYYIVECTRFITTHKFILYINACMSTYIHITPIIIGSFCVIFRKFINTQLGWDYLDFSFPHIFIVNHLENLLADILLGCIMAIMFRNKLCKWGIDVCMYKYNIKTS